MKLKIKKRYIFIIAIVLLIVFFFLFGGKSNAINTVKIIAVARGNLESITAVSGIVQEKNENDVYVDANV